LPRFRFNQSFSVIHDCSIQLRAYEFISNFVLDIHEVVFEETSSFSELEVRNECLMVDQERCTMLSVLNVDKNVKFHSNLTQADPSIAENVTLNEDPREEIDIKLQASIYSQHVIFFLSQYFFLFLGYTCTLMQKESRLNKPQNSSIILGD